MKNNQYLCRSLKPNKPEVIIKKEDNLITIGEENLYTIIDEND